MEDRRSGLRTALYIADNVVETLNQDGLVDGVGEPGANQGTSGHCSIDTNATTGCDTGRAADSVQIKSGME